MSGAGPLIEIEDLTRSYFLPGEEVRALRGISLRIDHGEFVAIMGPSGSGKSTLMSILGCLDAPTTGRYRLDGIDVSLIDDDGLADLRNRKLGFVFQTYNLVPRTSALANVELPLGYAGISRRQRHERAEAALSTVGMLDHARHLPSELSGGQQQRVAIARAIVTNPSLILADEPTGALDSHSGAEVMAMFEALNAEGRTLILITHEAPVAEHARRIVQIGDGRTVTDENNGKRTGRPRRAPRPRKAVAVR
ncbi:MAG: ABC transporter ATP-binding protein [Solirubrobacterales bacterium]